MAEIFVRLPPKSIIRFRSLSKYWHSRLATPEFIRTHRLQSSKNPPELLIRYVIYCGHYDLKDIYTLHPGDQLPLHIPGYSYLAVPKVEFPMLAWHVFSVVGSCNGVLCLHGDDNNISLWNLSIRRRVRVPSHPSFVPSAVVAAGFGFDPITDDYKIVAINFDEHKTFIYSLKTESWSEVPSPSSRLYRSSFSEEKPCFFSGILHWVVHPEDHHQSEFILTFNVVEMIGACSTPSRLGHVFPDLNRALEFLGPALVAQLTTINGCLALVSSEDGDSWKIRVMGEYGKTESWSLLLELKSDAFCRSAALQPSINGDLLAHYAGTDGDLLVLYGGSKAYNPQTRLLTKLMEYRPDCFILEMDMYVESLELADKERQLVGKPYTLRQKRINFIANVF